MNAKASAVFYRKTTMELFSRKLLIRDVDWVWQAAMAPAHLPHCPYPFRFSVAQHFPALLLCLTALTINACASSFPSIVEPATATGKSTLNTAYSKSTFGLHDISTFDVYVDDGIVHVIVGGKVSANDKQVKLRYTRSEDGGHQWNDPIALNDLPATIAIRGNDIQLAAKGDRLLAVWQTKGELPSMGPMVSTYSEDGGKTWKQGANPAINNAGDQSHIDLITDQQGNFHVVWLEDPEENGYQSLRYTNSVDGGKQWGKAATLDDSTCSCCWNTLTLSPENELNILYRDMTPRDMSLRQSSDNGKTWQRASTVGEFGWKFDGCPHVGGSLAYADTKNPKHLHSLVWTGAKQKAGLYHLASNDNGLSWSSPQKLGDAAVRGDIAAYDGNIIALWDEMEADGPSLFYAKSQDEGRHWSTATRLTQPKNSATHPRLITTEHGFLALWTEKPSKQASRLGWLFIE
jgi:BNR repeat-like domain